MYFLANRVKEVYATDLYEKRYLGGESSGDVLLHPEKYAPFHYRQDHLRVMRMDAGELNFESDTFDFLFCLSSLEHFGVKRRQLEALREMFRALKPGGVAALTTELVLNRLGSRKGYFNFDELNRLVRESGFLLTEPVDLAIEEEYARPPLAMPMEFQRTPHVVLRNFNIIFTSLSLFLSKPESAEKSKNAVTGPEQETPTRPFRWSARIKILDGPDKVKAEESFTLHLRMENTGDAPWFRNSSQSHMVRVGANWLDSDENDLGLDIPHFELPHDVRPGESVEATFLIPPIRKKGSFYLEIDLVKELCFWFREKGSEVKHLLITSY
jgi:SAM-dependent methyltransferase